MPRGTIHVINLNRYIQGQFPVVQFFSTEFQHHLQKFKRFKNQQQPYILKVSPARHRVSSPKIEIQTGDSFISQLSRDSDGRLHHQSTFQRYRWATPSSVNFSEIQTGDFLINQDSKSSPKSSSQKTPEDSRRFQMFQTFQILQIFQAIILCWSGMAYPFPEFSNF